MIASVSGVWVFRVIVCYLMVNILGLGLFGAWLTMVMEPVPARGHHHAAPSFRQVAHLQSAQPRKAGAEKGAASLVEIRQKAAWKAPSARLFLGRAR